MKQARQASRLIKQTPKTITHHTMRTVRLDHKVGKHAIQSQRQTANNAKR